MGQTWDETLKRNKELEARIAELEEAGTVAKRLLIQGHPDEALEHLVQNFKP